LAGSVHANAGAVIGISQPSGEIQQFRGRAINKADAEDDGESKPKKSIPQNGYVMPRNAPPCGALHNGDGLKSAAISIQSSTRRVIDLAASGSLLVARRDRQK
jgi:hypothetical protein